MSSEPSKKRKQFSLELKTKILDEVNAGQRKIDVAAKYGISTPTCTPKRSEKNFV